MELKRFFDIPYYQLSEYAQPDALVAKENGSWKKYSTQEFVDMMNKISRSLVGFGIQPDDKIAIIANNRPEWNFVDLGTLQAGAINVPVYPTISEEEFKFIFNDAEVKIVFVSDEELFRKVSNIKAAVPSLQAIYTFDQVEGADHWTRLLEQDSEQHGDEVDRRKEAIQPNDLATIIYTSGTTGTPKGVMLSHENVLSNLRASIPLLPINDQHRVLSFLPLNHVFERMITYLYMSQGVSIYYAESMETIGDNIREVQPHLFTAVPRLLEKVYDKIYAKGEALTGLKKKMFFWALNLGLKYEYGGANGWWYETQLGLANKLIFSKWREALGGNIIALVSGSAALQPRLARVFTAGKIPILEGYGLTETSPVISVNRVEEENRRFGTVGPVLDNVEVKIAEDGEILCKGPNVMLGYYKRQDLTDEVIDQDGWFHTGDIGTFVDGKFLKITDRKKEIFKTSGGKYVAPQVIENKLKESTFIEQIMVVGEFKKFVSALIVPAFPYLKEWCEKSSIPCGSNQEMVSQQAVIDQFQEIVDTFNPNFGHVEQIKKFALVPDEWNVDTGELTPTMKVKRKKVLEKYQHLVEQIYQD